MAKKKKRIKRTQKKGLMGKNKFYDRWGVKNETPQETKVSGMETYGVSGEVDLIYIMFNSDKALVGVEKQDGS